MNPLVFLLSHLFFFFFLFLVWQIEAQSSFSQESSEDVVTSFRPSLAVVITILVIMFALTVMVLVYAKCRGGGGGGVSVNHARQIGSSSRFSGIDKTVIESLPFFRFSSLKGSKQGLECAVCLSKFEDIEILRLLPKCKHAFHINCVDQWLEKHSSCPLCRHKVNADDPTIFTYSNSMRFSRGHSELQEDSNVEICVQREEDLRGPSSRFSFRKLEKGTGTTGGDKEELSLIRDEEEEDDKSVLHKFNHQIIVSDAVFKNRWSNVTSSDLMFLKSDMLNDMSSNRFDSLGWSNNNSTTSRAIKGEMEMKRLFVNTINKSSNQATIPTLPSTSDSSILSPEDRRSMSDITALSRFGNSGMKRKINDSGNDNAKEKRVRRLWLPIASRTVQLFANRETRTPQSHYHRSTTQPPLDV
ncbi:hypothetical protein HS088_TW23G00742 [Tripterygium wilfordii]|uniref:RING-type E3 ubiquitin transferase n=1 Tax=Tripterygium wilfordii TaxID=458696 RepID=A0A7J7BWD5_TRIWF|nr:E3 ubiquitin-protein ligase ATL42-like [Tripterygium wilfordii]KAF5726005.1 hypothetical protein HS088_TW23G00742 [Tripterygium wilfordii]